MESLARARSSSHSREAPRRSRSRSQVRTFAVVHGTEVSTTSPPPNCICARPYATVFCRNCGFLIDKGRVRTQCTEHARTLYLLDIECCPKCKAFPPILTEMKMA